MTEADILEAIFVIGSQMGENVQFWTSVSFGVLVASHLTKGQVSGFVIAIAIIFYSGFSWLIASNVLFEIGMIKSGVATLVQMAHDGEKLSLMSENAISNGPVATASEQTIISRRLVLVGMYLLTCAYPIYCWYTVRQHRE